MTPAEMAELKRLVNKLITEYADLQHAYNSMLRRREDIDIEYSHPCNDRSRDLGDIP